MKIAAALAALIPVLSLCACEYSPNMSDRTIAYNRAVADSTNTLLLLNVVRASQRAPTYYSRLEGDQASDQLQPSLNLSSPFSKAMQTTGTLTAGKPTTLATQKTLAALATTLGLQAQESNSLTLQTLDDQKYQRGMMTPVVLSNLQLFQDEGFQRDFLFLMFISNIRVSNDLLDKIDDAVGAQCTEILASDATSREVSLARQICINMKNRASHGILHYASINDGTTTLRACRDTGGAVADDSSTNMVVFINDLAREPIGQDAPGPHPEVCFQALLDDLLVLGLGIGSEKDIPSEVVDVIPNAVAHNPQFRSQMIQLKLDVKPSAKSGLSVVCQKKNEDVGFTLNFTNALSTVRTRTSETSDSRRDPRSLLVQGLAPTKKTAPTIDDNDCQHGASGKKGVDAEAILTSGEGGNTSQRAIKLVSDRIEFTTRSFEAVVYFLGEIVRYEDSPGTNPDLFIRVLGRNPKITGENYYETLFYASKHVASDDAAVSIRDDQGDVYSIPKPCLSTTQIALYSGRQGSCSVEYPDNESLEVLNLLNQVWGLEKEGELPPPTPALVISP